MNDMKNTIRIAVESNDLEAVAAMAERDKKAVSILVRMAYDKETVTAWRAIKSVGLIAQRMVDREPEFLREQVRKLLWSLNDESGGIGWAAPELIGEIISANPPLFRDMISPLTTAFDAEERTFRPGIVYALLKIAEKSPEIAAIYQRVIISSLVDKEPITRIYGLGLVSLVWDTARRENIWTQEYSDKIKEVVRYLESDKQEAWIFQNSNFKILSVAEQARELIKKLI